MSKVLGVDSEDNEVGGHKNQDHCAKNRAS